MFVVVEWAHIHTISIIVAVRIVVLFIENYGINDISRNRIKVINGNSQFFINIGAASAIEKCFGLAGERKQLRYELLPILYLMP
ncbi:hypothetical protein ATN79_20585 [Paraburkholderia caribensis]|nr:hypothetical protein ATN79_20585 [Paraburkholderia caribensis]